MNINDSASTYKINEYPSVRKLNSSFVTDSPQPYHLVKSVDFRSLNSQYLPGLAHYCNIFWDQITFCWFKLHFLCPILASPHTRVSDNNRYSNNNSIDTLYSDISHLDNYCNFNTWSSKSWSRVFLANLGFWDIHLWLWSFRRFWVTQRYTITYLFLN